MPKNQSPNAVSLDTKIVYIKAYLHLLLIPCLYFLLTLIIVGATAYNYYNLPDSINFNGMSVKIPDEELKNMKKMVLQGMGGITLIPFLVLGVLSGAIAFYKNKFWYGFCALFTMGLIFFFSGYCISTLTIMKLKYVWPVHVVKEVMETTPFPNFPFSMEQSIENMVRVLILTITICMFLAVAVQVYCAFVLVNLSFLYTPPKSVDLHTVKVAPRQKKKREETAEEEKGTEGGETGTQTADEEEGKSKTSDMKQVSEVKKVEKP